MSYTPTTWQTGDTITAEKMNKMEQGIANSGGGGGCLFVSDNDGTLNKTWNEIWTAMSTTLVIITYIQETEIDHFYVTGCNHNDPEVYVIMTHDGSFYETNSANGYPILA